MEQRRNLKPFLKRFSRGEMAILAKVIQSKQEWADYHIGMLPFMDHKKVVMWLKDWSAGNSNFTRIHAKILSKLYVDTGYGFQITLNDGKIFRQFGEHPERGVQIPGLPTYHQPRQRMMFERKVDAIEVRNHIVSLKHIGTNRWLVACRERVRKHVQHWLEENLK